MKSTKKLKKKDAILIEGDNHQRIVSSLTQSNDRLHDGFSGSNVPHIPRGDSVLSVRHSEMSKHSSPSYRITETEYDHPKSKRDLASLKTNLSTIE